MRTVGAALGAACLMAVGSASAAVQPTVTGLTADPWGPANSDPTEIYVLGDARFGNEDPLTVGADPQNDPERPQLGLFGMDVRTLAIWQPDFEASTIWFSMSFWDFQAVAPEVATWRWTMTVYPSAGDAIAQTNGKVYQLEAARGGYTLDSTQQGGLGTIFTQNGMDAFRLLGPCAPDSSSCPFLTQVGGMIDMNADRITWQIPIGSPFTLGSVVAPHADGARATFGAGPITYHDRVTQTGSYSINSRGITVWVQTPFGDRVTDLYAALPPPVPSQPFWANLLVSHLPRGIPNSPDTPYDVVAQACGGTLCSEIDCTSAVKVACVRVML